MKDMTEMTLNAWLRYANYWNKVNEKCKEAIDASDWDAADHYLRLMDIANNLSKIGY